MAINKNEMEKQSSARMARSQLLPGESHTSQLSPLEGFRENESASKNQKVTCSLWSPKTTCALLRSQHPVQNGDREKERLLLPGTRGLDGLAEPLPAVLPLLEKAEKERGCITGRSS